SRLYREPNQRSPKPVPSRKRTKIRKAKREPAALQSVAGFVKILPCNLRQKCWPIVGPMTDVGRETTAMAHTKGQGSSRTGRDSNAQRLGVKKFGGEAVVAGNILIRQ